jgi:hypothetical protein
MTMLIVNAFIVMNENVYVRTDSPTLFLSVERESVYNTPAKPHGLDRERTAETSRTHSYLHIIIRRRLMRVFLRRISRQESRNFLNFARFLCVCHFWRQLKIRGARARETEDRKGDDGRVRATSDEDEEKSVGQFFFVRNLRRTPKRRSRSKDNQYGPILSPQA